VAVCRRLSERNFNIIALILPCPTYIEKYHTLKPTGASIRSGKAYVETGPLSTLEGQRLYDKAIGVSEGKRRGAHIARHPIAALNL
jgi:hypothetical protein